MPSPAGEQPGSRSWGSQGNKTAGCPGTSSPEDPLAHLGFTVQQQQRRRDVNKSFPAAGVVLTLQPPKPSASHSPLPAEPPAPAAFSKPVLCELRLTSKQPANLACWDN